MTMNTSNSKHKKPNSKTYIIHCRDQEIKHLVCHSVTYYYYFNHLLNSTLIHFYVFWAIGNKTTHLCNHQRKQPPHQICMTWVLAHCWTGHPASVFWQPCNHPEIRTTLCQPNAFFLSSVFRGLVTIILISNMYHVTMCFESWCHFL